MSIRRIVPIVLAVVALIGGVAVGHRKPVVRTVDFGTDQHLPMPVAALGGDTLTSSWFCPGVPSDGADGSDGTITILNPVDTALQTVVTAFPTTGDPVTKAVTVPERSRIEVRAHDLVTSPYAAVLVELVAGRGLVSQSVVTKLGSTSSPCANDPSASWFLADGSTVLGDDEMLLLFNPFPDQAIVNITVVEDVLRRPQAFQGIVLAPRSMRAVSLGEVVQRKVNVSVEAVASRGRFVMGRVQTFTGATRKGMIAGLAAPAAGNWWSFAEGEKSAKARTRFVVYNPGDRDANVVTTLYPAAGLPLDTTGAPAAGSSSTTGPTSTVTSAAPSGSTPTLTGPQALPITTSVPARSTVTVDVTASADVTEGRYHAVVTSDQPVVVERTMELVSDRGAVSATGVLGSRFESPRWYLPAGLPAATVGTLTVANHGSVEVTVVLHALGAAGEVDVPGSTPTTLPPGGSARIAVPAAAASQSLVVDAKDADGKGAAVVVEQIAVPTAAKAVWATAVLALPEVGS
jgi:hypothetical protein